jgi:hypothetical protein
MTDAKRKPWEILDRISWPPKHEKKNGNVWETFGNSIMLLSYLVSYVVNVGKKKRCPLRRAMWSIVQHVLFPQNMVIL